MVAVKIRSKVPAVTLYSEVMVDPYDGSVDGSVLETRATRLRRLGVLVADLELLPRQVLPSLEVEQSLALGLSLLVLQ